MNHPLSAAGSVSDFGGRFNYGIHINSTQFKPFGALYLAETHKIALCEKYGIPSDISSKLSDQELGLAPTSHHYVRLSGQLNSVLDIRKASSLKKFVQIITTFEIDDRTNEMATLAGISPMKTIKLPKELKINLHDRNWRAAPTQVNLPANSQVFGKLVRDAGIEGILYNSVRGDGSCLALFPENFEQSESILIIEDEMADSVGITQLNKDTWKGLL
jgi:hypothetical protein